MTYDPKNPHYDPYTAPPVFDGSQPVTGPGYPDGGYPDSPQPQQAGYPDQYSYAQPAPAPVYNPMGYAPPPVYVAPDNGTGTAALVLGIIGLVTCIVPCSVVAIITGHIGVKKADRGEADNRGHAQAGLIMGYIGAGLAVLVIVFYILMFVFAFGLAASTETGSY